ncbi:LysE family translocator [Amycolatopsis pithecellobii]|nr:LysE family translocator [Amycolatopsis pithecellobii]
MTTLPTGAELLRYVVLVTGVIIAPGADLALVLTSAVRGGRQGGLATTMGIVSGVFVWAALAGAGLAGVLVASATGYLMLRLAGAAYLLFLGIKFLAQSRSVAPPVDRTGGAGKARSFWSYFRRGWVADVMNPKMAVFYLAVLSNFLHPGDFLPGKVFFLALVHASIGLLWFSSISLAVGRSNILARNPRVRRMLNLAGGAVLVLLSIEVALPMQW